MKTQIAMKAKELSEKNKRSLINLSIQKPLKNQGLIPNEAIGKVIYNFSSNWKIMN